MAATQYKAWYVKEAGAKLEETTITQDKELGANEVEVKVIACGICHTDVSLIDNEWGITNYSNGGFVPGHEVVGEIVAVGNSVKGRKVGQKVAIGYQSGYCNCCNTCLKGDQNLCGEAKLLLVNDKPRGGFAERCRCEAEAAFPIPDGVDPIKIAPAVCGGLTVISPMFNFITSPNSRVGVIGCGGLGHMAVLFAKAMGFGVTAFTSNPASKGDEIKKLGADTIVDSKDNKAIRSTEKCDLIICTANALDNPEVFIDALAPRGRLHFVGALVKPIPTSVFSLMGGMKSISSSPVGSPGNAADMYAVCARHKIEPVVEVFPIAKINDAIAKVKDGSIRYRAVVTL